MLKNSIGGASQRLMVAAAGDESARAFSTVAVLYAGAGLATGLLIAGWARASPPRCWTATCATRPSSGVVGLGAVTAVGLAMSVNLDAVRAALLLTRSAANEIAGLVLFAALMLTLALSGAPLWALIAASGSIPLLQRHREPGARRRLGLPYRCRRGGFTASGRARWRPPPAGCW